MVVSQIISEADIHDFVLLLHQSSRRSPKDIPKTLTELSHCSISSSQKVKLPTIQFRVDYKERNKDVMDYSKLEDFVWIMANVSSMNYRSNVKMKESLDCNSNYRYENSDEHDIAMSSSGNFIPSWLAYQSYKL